MFLIGLSKWNQLKSIRTSKSFILKQNEWSLKKWSWFLTATTATAAHRRAHDHRGAQMLCNQHTDWTVLRLHAVMVGRKAKPSGSFLQAFSQHSWEQNCLAQHSILCACPRGDRAWQDRLVRKRLPQSNWSNSQHSTPVQCNINTVPTNWERSKYHLSNETNVSVYPV